METGVQQNPEELPVSVLPRVTDKLASALERIGVFQIKDLLLHLPYRYQDRTRSTPLGELVPGRVFMATGRIVKVQVNFGRSRSLVTQIQDDTGAMRMRLFHFNTRQRHNLESGSWIRCFGEVRLISNAFEMAHPEYAVYNSPPPEVHGDSYTPVYRLTEGIGQRLMRDLVKSAIDLFMQQDIADPLPDQIRRQYDLAGLRDALQIVHAPPVGEFELQAAENHQPAVRRLVFEELVSFQIARRKHKQLRQSVGAPQLRPQGTLSRRLRDSLTFEPTNSQRRVIREVIDDLKKSAPMLRLLQGDVGCGKTLVAAAAAAWTVDSGFQIAIMAPTELLAEQHLKSFTGWFEPLGIQVHLLTGRLQAKKRKEIEQAIRSGQANIVVGTHALFQEKVEFHNLGMVIVDEQHRFGVGQRYAFRQKGVSDDLVPHQLVMTATPIPRTLAMTFYADLDVSSITELPPGRQPVQTQIMASANRHDALQQARRQRTAGQQVYWVCPIIEKSEVLDVESAVEMEKVIKKALPQYRIGLVHGRLKSDRRDRIMKSFRDGKIDVLVATTVIEVGVDVPNASLMVIESADRLGLSQLHQLRGRVGRGAEQAKCLLLFKAPLAQSAKKRLEVMQKTTDGFLIAETDLRLRGAGELLGTRQTGSQLFRVAELPRDMNMINEVNQAAQLILNQYPDNAQELIRRWTPREGEYSAV
ncbi:MAG: ATP-dependent DNA helicase RecG [Acidiferrobacterales bacterium]|nr:ATP-dependent DNA helicase RecG [Acidiferrobacterales bacterium]